MLPAIAREAARRFADATAYVAPDGWGLSYRDLDRVSDELAVGRDTEFAVTRSFIALGGALLEEEGVGRELELAVSHAIAQQHLPAGERGAVVQTPERRDRALVEQRDDATARD